jgi:two-component system, cell cycle sensor histidine kinase and response regulator CckA
MQGPQHNPGGGTLRVLHVEDSAQDAELVERQLRKAGYDVAALRVDSAAAFAEALAGGDWDVIIADYSVPRFGAVPALKLLKQSERDIPFIILSGMISDEAAVASMRAGAHDYVLKNNLARLVPAIEREMQEVVTRRQKRQAEAALQEADAAIHVRETRLQGIIGSAMDAIISVDEQQRIVVFNHAAEKMFVCTVSEALGSSLDRFIPAKFREIHRDHVRHFGVAGVTTRSMYSPGVLTALRSNGEEFPIEAAISQVEAAGQKVYTVILRDITERKQAEKALRESQKENEFLADLIRTSSQPLAVGYPDGRLGLMNHAFEQVTGYNAEELRCMDWAAALTPPEWRELEREKLAELHLTGRPVRYEKEYLRKDGTRVPIELLVHEVTDSDGKPQQYYAFVTDITERKRTEEALRQSEERFRSMYQNAAVGIKQVAIDGRLLMANPALCKMLGYTEAELLRKTFTDLTYPEDLGGEAALLESMLRGEREFWEIEKRYVHRNGSPLWVSVTSSLVKDAAGHPLYRVSIIVDITEKKRAEALDQQLQQAQKLEAIGQLAGGISHDFNTLLNVMLGYSELLKAELPAVDLRRERVEQIETAAQMGAVLTKQLLAFSRKHAVAPQVIDLSKAVAGLEPMLRRVLPEDIELEAHYSGETCPVKVDPGHVQQVILNLATNARDAMPRGGNLTIEVRTVELDEAYVQQHPLITPGRYEMLAVSDTGVGMDAETANHIFEPFFTTKETGKGTGLGLSTVYGIVKQSRGDIFVYSEPGLGSIFKVYFPRSSEAIATAEPSRPLPRNLTGNETILLVEDSKPLRQLTHEVLSREGYAVLEAADGVEALELFKNRGGKVHLLMTDIVMPKMRGTELAAQITQQCPDLPVIYLSGYTEDAMSHVYDRGRISILEKPYTGDMLLRTVRQALDDAQITA